SPAAAGVVTTSSGPWRLASASSSGVVSTTSPRNAVWMTRAGEGCGGVTTDMSGAISPVPADGGSGARERSLEHPAGPAGYDHTIRPARGVHVNQRLSFHSQTQPQARAQLQAVERRHEGLALEHSSEVEKRGAHELDLPCRAHQTAAQLHRSEFDTAADEALRPQPAV